MFTQTALRLSTVAGRQMATRSAMRHASTTTTANNTARNSKFLISAGVAIASATAFGVSVTAMDSAVAVDDAKVRDAIADILADQPTLGGTFVRLAWHASGTYCKNTNTGGSNGAGMRFSPEADWGANAGLHVARNALEPVKRKFPNMSYSDLWTLAGVVSISEMGGPEIAWRGGRSDVNDGSKCVPDGRLPNADLGSQAATIQHVRDIFGRMGFNDQEMVALIGAHAVGRCHTEYSGYWGPWTRAETTFSNEYFRELLENTWTIKKWSGPQQYEDPSGDLMMLPADMALIWDPAFKKYCEMYAKDEDKFFKDFSSAFQKLEENGCGFPEIKNGWFSWLGF